MTELHPALGDEEGTTRLLTVANRLPVTITNDDGRAVVTPSVGGLASGLRSVVRGDRHWWIGWPGETTGLSAVDLRDAERQLAALHTIPVSLTQHEIEIFYEKISNAVLWPICHDRIDRLPLHIDGWPTYEAVNRRYADAVVARWRPGDVIWVHDYQLMRVPHLIRQQIPDATIGFFLHVPFPNPEIFFTLSTRRWLLEGLLGADLIGFHTRRYRGHFTGALRRLFSVEMDPSTGNVPYNGRTVQLGIFPMGIDADEFMQRSTELDVSAETLALKQGNTRLLVGIDRLDYSKGIERRLIALERLLISHPEWRERVRLIQVAVPSRGRVGAYRRLRSDVEGLVGRINGEFATPTWTPIQYLHRSVSPTTLAALYRAADVMLVTPVRDGMNLVAKEFVATRGDEEGVLILSEFAGAADELTDAIIVNPYDLDRVATAINDSLLMCKSDRRARMRKLRAQVFGNDVRRWADNFLTTLLATRRGTPAGT